MWNVIVIGGGASGLMAAIWAARNQCKVTIIERKDKLGKKILATGNGKCNYTNYYQEESCYRGADSKQAMKVYENFDVHQTIQFFEELGIYPKERNGYVYPNSGQAASVLDVLVLEAKRLGVHMVANEKVTAVKKEKGGFFVVTDQKNYTCNHVILTTGGCASPKLGSDGSGYVLAKSLGHSITKPLPALVQLKSNAKYLKTISGVRTDAAVTLKVNGKKASQEKGEILFANYGISGIPVMQVSRFASVALDQGAQVELSIDFLPEVSYTDMLEEIKQRLEHGTNRTAEQLFLGLFNHKLTYILLKEAGIDAEMPSTKVRYDAWKKLANLVKDFKMKITDTNGLENAQTSTGGIPLDEVSLETMESKKVKGLYFAGELLDVDGTCGGYNLQWAWSSGYMAGNGQNRN